jgi:glycosyltransferase involved in cell wall biosynthesis
MLTPDDVDIILASGDPFLAFKLAKLLSDRLRRPYVLDYRDPWTGNLHATQADRPATVQLEARLLTHAAEVTIVSRAWSIAMDQRFALGPKLHVVSNGYDPNELEKVRPHDFGHFAIVYTGGFYPPKRVISPVMAALERLKATTAGSTCSWYFHYYGIHEDHVRAEAQRFGVAERVVLHGRVPRAEALSAVCGAGVTVVITAIAEKGTLADNGMVTGKLFEALGLKTPILLICPSESDAAAIIADAGVHASFTGTDIDGMSRHLLQLMSGRIRPSQSAAPERYAWPELVKPLDALLRSHLLSM